MKTKTASWRRSGSDYKPPSHRGLEGGWSKWGGGNHNVIKEQIREDWFCQSCQEKQPATMKPYLLELIIGDWFRVCAKCYRDNGSEFRNKRLR